MKPVGYCRGWYGRTPQSSRRLASSAQGTPFGCPKGEPRNANLQTPYEIKLPTCIRKTIEYQHYRYRQGQQPALASPRRTARYERISPDGFDMAALEVTLCGGTPPPPNGGSPRTERSPLPCGHLPTPWGVTPFRGGYHENGFA